MKRYFLLPLLALILTRPCFAQQNVVAKINDIKLDSLMLYGEATESSEQNAKTFALEGLRETFEEYKGTHSNVQLDSSKIGILKHSRGKNVRVFVYVHIDSLSTKSTNPAIEIFKMEEDLINLKNIDDLMTLLGKEPYSSHTCIGVVDLSADDYVIHTSYILVTRGSGKNIIEIYSPSTESGNRRAIRSGTQTMSISFRPNDKIYWLNINK